MFKKFGILFVALAVIILAGGAYAFASAVTIEDQLSVGSGQSVVNGYIVSDIVYVLDANKVNVTAINFNITGTTAADVVQIQTATDGTWKEDCTVGAAVETVQAITCNYGTPIALSSVTELNVFASGGD